MTASATHVYDKNCENIEKYEEMENSTGLTATRNKN